ncbi:MAG: hypothetical protein IPI06_10525 [Gammaproteobacteria bacterium]|nr:hypothetical protein [Gammaproteobacteria bacterium]
MTQQQLITRSYTMRFLTPAFLGDAVRAGAWRMPPFKAALRQWWRIAVASQFQYDCLKMREAEGQLFGHAWLENDRDESGKCVSARRSQVRMRLDRWVPGRLDQAPEIGRIERAGGKPASAALYLGYGPIETESTLKSKPAIKAGEERTLKLAFPEADGIEAALALMNRFGTVGGRCRNGWGSFELAGELTPTSTPLVEWRDAMKRDWVHGIGQDQKGALIWESMSAKDWEAVMLLLARLRADLRRNVSDRLLLAYPDTKASMPGWRGTDRVPHSLRFKVRRRGEGYVGAIFHAPCRPSDALWSRLSPEKQQQLPEVFQEAHDFLDSRDELTRCNEVKP